MFGRHVQKLHSVSFAAKLTANLHVELRSVFYGLNCVCYYDGIRLRYKAKQMAYHTDISHAHNTKIQAIERQTIERQKSKIQKANKKNPTLRLRLVLTSSRFIRQPLILFGQGLLSLWWMSPSLHFSQYRSGLRCSNSLSATVNNVEV